MGAQKKSNTVPDFSHYKSNNPSRNLMFQYFMVGTMGALAAMGAKATVQGMFEVFLMIGSEFEALWGLVKFN
jgi:hypothetical protein